MHQCHEQKHRLHCINISDHLDIKRISPGKRHASEQGRQVPYSICVLTCVDAVVLFRHQDHNFNSLIVNGQRPGYRDASETLCDVGCDKVVMDKSRKVTQSSSFVL